MKYFLMGLTLLLCVPFTSFAQETPADEAIDIPEPPIRFVVGIEGGYGVHNVKGPGLKNIGFSVEVPWKKFSIGTGIMLKSMGDMQYMNHTGYSFNKKTDAGEVTYYEYDRHKVDLEYISIPLRVQMRLPCNCVYVQAGVEMDILRQNTDKVFETDSYNSSPEGYMQTDIVKDVNYTFVLGVGFKLHESRRLRIFLRPEYEFMLNHVKEGTVYHKDAVLNRLKVGMGIQYGI